MAHTIRRAIAVNTDGRPHPVQDTLAAVTAVLAVVAIVCAFFSEVHILGAWAGLVGIVTALTGQMFSATTAERFPLVIGLGASAVGLFINMANGGLY
jgi:hypothetical protein